MGSRILLVDDDVIFRCVAAETLRTAGYVVEEAADYRAALPILEQDSDLDLLITDIVMPGRVNGYALGRMARMRRHTLPILYVTGSNLPTDEALGKVLRKPVMGDALIDEVRAVLAKGPQPTK